MGFLAGHVRAPRDPGFDSIASVTRLLAVIFMIVAPDALQAGLFVPDDRLVSDPAISMKDPEFDSVGNLMTWQDSAGNLWLADVNPVTGEISPTSGQGLMVDTGLANPVYTGNGPEFGYGAGETFLCYTKLESSTRYLGVARKDAFGAWIPSIQDLSSNSWRPLCSLPGNPDTGRMVYVKEISPGQKVVSWREIDDPASEVDFADIGSTGGRWTGERAFVAPVDVAGVKQLFWVDIDTGEATQITFDADDKINIFAWHAPEYNETLISAAINVNSVGIFRNIGGTWTRIYTFNVPSSFQFVSSPEAFVHNGKSYITVVAARELYGTGPLPYLPSGPSEIWIANIDASAPFFRRIDSGAPGIRRLEPEPFMLDSGPVVYFTETDPVTGNALLRVADTGLGSPSVSDTDGDGVSDDRDNCILVANPPQRETNSDGIGNRCDPDLNNDCIVNITDYLILKSLFGTSFSAADFNGDGIVDTADFNIMSPYFFMPPGPASTPNACEAGL